MAKVDNIVDVDVKTVKLFVDSEIINGEHLNNEYDYSGYIYGVDKTSQNVFIVKTVELSSNLSIYNKPDIKAFHTYFITPQSISEIVLQDNKNVEVDLSEIFPSKLIDFIPAQIAKRRDSVLPSAEDENC